MHGIIPDADAISGPSLSAIAPSRHWDVITTSLGRHHCVIAASSLRHHCASPRDSVSTSPRRHVTTSARHCRHVSAGTSSAHCSCDARSPALRFVPTGVCESQARCANLTGAAPPASRLLQADLLVNLCSATASPNLPWISGRVEMDRRGESGRISKAHSRSTDVRGSVPL